MNIDEIMIGNRLLHVGKEPEVCMTFEITVLGITTDGKIIHEGPCDEDGNRIMCESEFDEFKPIVLDPRYFEERGFEINYDEETNEPLTAELYNKTEDGRGEYFIAYFFDLHFFDVNSYDNTHGSFHIGNCHFVHDVQNVLNICKIKLEDK